LRVVIFRGCVAVVWRFIDVGSSANGVAIRHLIEGLQDAEELIRNATTS